MSKGWGGCTSDKHLTEQCGILDHPLLGDRVLADHKHLTKQCGILDHPLPGEQDCYDQNIQF